MDTTSPTLLRRLREPDAAAAWGRFVDLYSPMLYRWARGFGLQEADAADLVQDVFAGLCQALPRFEYDGSRGFRKWLWTVTRNKLAERRRRGRPAVGFDVEPVAPDAGPMEVAEADFRSHLLGQLLPSFGGQFHPATWAAFWRHVVEGRPAADVAAELGVTPAAVYKAKVRVIARLHDQLSDLL